MRKSLRKDQSGYTMVLVLVAMLIVSLLSTAVISMASSNLKIGVKEREFQASYYIAEAGAVYYTDQIKKKVWDIYNDTAVTNESQFYAKVASELSSTLTLPLGLFDEEYGGQPEARVSFIQTSGDTNPRTYSLVSEGTNDDTTRIVQKEITLNYTTSGVPSDLLAVFSDGDMNFGGGTVEGPVGTNSNINVLGYSDPQIDDYYLYENDAEIIVSEIYNNWMDRSRRGNREPLGEMRTYELPPFPVFPSMGHNGSMVVKLDGSTYDSITLSDSVTYVPGFAVGSGDTLKINVGNTDKILMMDNFVLSHGYIHLVGTGKLTLYIKNDFIVAGSAEINPSEFNTPESKLIATEKLKIYVEKSDPAKTIEFANNMLLNGSFYSENANLILNGSGKMVGNIYTGGSDVRIAGGSSALSQMIYAPNAYVHMDGSGCVNGPIISSTFYMEGGATVNYNPGDPLPPDGMLPPDIDDIVPTVGGTRER